VTFGLVDGSAYKGSSLALFDTFSHQGQETDRSNYVPSTQGKTSSTHTTLVFQYGAPDQNMISFSKRIERHRPKASAREAARDTTKTVSSRPWKAVYDTVRSTWGGRHLATGMLQELHVDQVLLELVGAATPLRFRPKGVPGGREYTT
jgi:hypothetical protein